MVGWEAERGGGEVKSLDTILERGKGKNEEVTLCLNRRDLQGKSGTGVSLHIMGRKKVGDGSKRTRNSEGKVEGDQFGRRKRKEAGGRGVSCKNQVRLKKRSDLSANRAKGKKACAGQIRMANA